MAQACPLITMQKSRITVNSDQVARRRRIWLEILDATNFPRNVEETEEKKYSMPFQKRANESMSKISKDCIALTSLLLTLSGQAAESPSSQSLL